MKKLTLTQAAELKNTSRQALHMAICSGRLKAEKIDGQWRIYSRDLNEYYQGKYSKEFSEHNGKRIFNEDKGLITLDRSSEIAQVPKQKLYYAIRMGYLKASRKGAAYVIQLNDLYEYMIFFMKSSEKVS